MINLYKQDGETLYGIKEYLLDTVDDLSSLPDNIRIGSSALILSTGDLYILNGEKKWVLFAFESSSSSGSDSDSSDALDKLLSKYDANADGKIDTAESVQLHSL